jgi:hypothetical protein
MIDASGVYLVNPVDPFVDILVQLVQARFGLVHRQIEHLGSVLDADLPRRGESHPNAVAYPGQHEVTGSSGVDEVSFKRFFTEGFCDEREIQFFFSTESLREPGMLHHRDLQATHLDALVACRLLQLLPAQHRPVRLSSQRLGELCPAPLV